MSLVKCKECGKKVSDKAKSCPECGAVPPKKTSIFTWFILGVIVLIGFAYASKESPTRKQVNAINAKANIGHTVPEAQSKSEEIKPVKVEPIKIEPVKPSWYVKTSKDKMTGKVSAYAHSPSVDADRTMSFPYGDVKSWMGVGCDSDSEWIYFGFSTSPNLSNTVTEDGYNAIRTRIKWDDKVEDVRLRQDWGSKFIHFNRYASALEKVSSSNRAMIELKWHGQSSVFFNYTLNGSSKALAEIRDVCKKAS